MDKSSNALYYVITYLRWDLSRSILVKGNGWNLFVNLQWQVNFNHRYIEINSGNIKHILIYFIFLYTAITQVVETIRREKQGFITPV